MIVISLHLTKEENRVESVFNAYSSHIRWYTGEDRVARNTKVR